MFFYHVAHAEEADAVFQERGYHYFIGGINDARHVPSAIHRFVSECQIAETFRVGLLKRQVRAFGEIEPVERRTDTVGIGECILDGQAHIGMPNCAFTAPSSNCTIE